METVLGIAALIMVAFAVAGTVVAVKAVRTVRRGVAQVRGAVAESALRAGSLIQTGAAGELAALRLSLRTSLTGTGQALAARVPGDPALREAMRLLDRLREHAHVLDGELRALAREPHRARIAARLPELRSMTEHVTRSADALRWAAQERAQRFGAEELGALVQDIEIEAGALRHWTSAAEQPRLAAVDGPPAAAAALWRRRPPRRG